MKLHKDVKQTEEKNNKKSMLTPSHASAQIMFGLFFFFHPENKREPLRLVLENLSLELTVFSVRKGRCLIY